MTPIAATWGSTEADRALPFPCDRFLAEPDHVLFRAVEVDAPAPVLFRWLCQLRAGPYSYDWIDNLGRRSPRRLTPGLDGLETGQRFMRFFELAEFERDRHVTLAARLRRLGDVAVTYLAAPTGDRTSRLVVKMLVRYPRLPVVGWALRLVLPPGDLVMMRKQLLNLKRLAESTRD
jgi:hypothetical protein